MKGEAALTLSSTNKSFHSFDDLVSVTIRVDADLLQLFVAHFHQDVQSYLMTQTRINITPLGM